LTQYVSSIALLIAILLAFGVVVYLVEKLRGKK
jgi:ABC-type phosphate transport system permease subunit